MEVVIKLIIAGSRTIDQEVAFQAICKFFNTCSVSELEALKEVVSGTAKGVDSAGEEWAELVEIKCTRFPADWDNKGRGAGHIRNAEMGKYADALLLIWDGQSKGSASMKSIMEKLNKPIYEVIIK